MIEFWFEILHFTLLQSALSGLFSLLIGVFLARFLYCHKGLRLEKYLKSFGALTFVVPVMLPALAFLMLFENTYGIVSIVSVHIFLNALYCMTQLHGAYEGFITQEKEQSAELLHLTTWQRLRHLEYPTLKESSRHSFMVVFCLCLSSFSVILLLGGGPSSTTLSVALYHALSVRLDFFEASFFLGLQLLLSLSFALFLHVGKNQKTEGAVTEKLTVSKKKWCAEIFLLGVLLFYTIPFLKFFQEALSAISHIVIPFEAILVTLFIGMMTALLTLFTTLFILMFYLKTGRVFKTSMSIIGTLLLSLPKIAIVGSVFLLMHSYLDVEDAAYVLIIMVGMLCYIPFVLMSSLSDFKGLQNKYTSQIQLLSLSYKQISQLIIWPHLSQSIRQKTAMVSCFAMGNLSLPLLLGKMEIKTLPVLSYQALLRYDTEASSFYMLCLIALMGFVFFLCQGMKNAKN